MYSVTLIKHEDIGSQMLYRICELKSLHWKFTIEKQLSWIKENIQNEDYHLLITDDTQLVAYTNLVNIEVGINEEMQSFKGIGNVCTRHSGKGLGNILMEAVNQALTEHKWQGILLCKDALVKYYEKNHWKLIEQEKVVQEKYKEVNIMVFNNDLPVNVLSYDGRNF